jgi:hypothetical protein
MVAKMDTIDIFVETGKKKIFVGVVDWPGWCRWGKTEKAALQSLIEYGNRYVSVLQSVGINSPSPNDASAFVVVERHQGNATTDFGAHDIPLERDCKPVDQAEYLLWQRILNAAWAEFDQAVVAAHGRTLRKGPRGGGRDLQKIILHVLQADESYLRRVAWRVSKGEPRELAKKMLDAREMILQALDVAVNQGLPEKGPRGGKIWSVRFFIRRVIWHVLDHAWEIEDRLE